MLSPTKKALFVAVLFVIVLAFVEIAAYPAARILAGRNILYEPRRADDYAHYLEIRDPVVGWPSPSEDKQNRDAAGARYSPAFPDPAVPACVSTYGDSFTWGQGVTEEEAWGNVLASELGCRVANFGVGGYGTDQAIVRHRRNDRDTAPIAILGHQPENILRNLNQYRALLDGVAVRGFKPRFVPRADGELELIPIPSIAVDDYDGFVERPGAFLEHETFAPGIPPGPDRLGFPYTLSLLRGLSHFHVRKKLLGEPFYIDFYDPEHPARGLEVTTGIVARFASEAHRRGQHPMVVILPNGGDLTYMLASGRWSFQPLLDRAEALGVEIDNLGDEMLDRLDGTDPCSVFIRCSGHYDASGNRLVGRILSERVRSRAAASAIELDGPDSL